MTYRELFEEEYIEKRDFSSVSQQELKMGKKVEQEHKPTYDMIQNYLEKYGHLPSRSEVYKSIALDHLIEIEDYYTRLHEMEKQAGVKG